LFFSPITSSSPSRQPAPIPSCRSERVCPSFFSPCLIGRPRCFTQTLRTNCPQKRGISVLIFFLLFVSANVIHPPIDAINSLQLAFFAFSLSEFWCFFSNRAHLQSHPSLFFFFMHRHFSLYHSFFSSPSNGAHEFSWNFFARR